MRVLGVDPGTVRTGWGVVEEVGRRPRRVAGGVIRAAGPLPVRLGRIHGALGEVLRSQRVDAVSLEKTFVSENVQSAFRLGEARGAILVAAAQARVPVFEYAPAEVKMAAAGYGRASKAQMQAMIARLLELPQPPAVDEADALAVALCHLHSRTLPEAAGAAMRRSRRAARRPAEALPAWRVRRRSPA